MAFVIGFLVVLAMAAGVSFILAFPVKWCWNYTMPHIFKLPEIGWGQAWCLAFLAGSFFKTSVSRDKK